jgi:hypothetical protein
MTLRAAAGVPNQVLLEDVPVASLIFILCGQGAAEDWDTMGYNGDIEDVVNLLLDMWEGIL